MNLASIENLVFILSILAVLYFINNQYRWILLLIASIFFLVQLSPVLILHIVFFSIINFGILNVVNRYPEYRKAIVNTGIALNLAYITFYRYIGYYFTIIFSSSDNSFFDKLLVPVGISFFTFQAIGYLLNVYRKVEKEETNYFRYLLYIIYFPKFVSGPFENYTQFTKQTLNINLITRDEGIVAGKFIISGLLKKYVIADRLMPLVYTCYSDPTLVDPKVAVFLLFIQPLALYADFSGYTDIILGISKLFGINLTNNFNRPFLATSVTTFWKRFHASLGIWCNEFIFKRVMFKYRKMGNTASSLAVLLTFVFFGIWHGAGINFFIIGLLQAIAIIYEFYTRKYRIQMFSKVPRLINLWFSRITVYIFYCFTLIFFFSKGFSNAAIMIQKVFESSGSNFFEIVGKFNGLSIYFSLSLMGLLLIYEIMTEDNFNNKSPFAFMPKYVRMAIYAGIVLLVLTFGLFAGSNFYYSNF